MNPRRCCILTIMLAVLILCCGGAAAQEVRVAEAVICQQVVDRMPVGIGEVVPAVTERVYCYTRIEGAAGETEVTHNWYYQGALKASIVLPVRTANWRTWSAKRLMPAWKGEWMVEVLSPTGAPLESILFLVQ